MNKKNRLLLVIGAAWLIANGSGPVYAQATTSTIPPASVTFTGNVSVVSDYVFRGLSFSDEDPVLQGGVDVEWHKGFYVGIWGSGVDKPFGAVYNKIGGDEDFEYDLYAGWHSSGNKKVVFDLGAIRYGFEPDDDDLSWTEVYASAKAYGLKLQLNSRVEGADMGNYIELSYFRAIKNLFDIKLHAGHWDLDRERLGTTSYSDFSIGVGKTYKGFRFELSYTGTDDDGKTRYGRFADDRAVLFISKQFKLGSR